MFNEKADVIRLATGGPLSRDEAHSIKEHVNQLKQNSFNDNGTVFIISLIYMTTPIWGLLMIFCF